MKADNEHSKAMDEALAANPPHIVWRKNNHGVLVYVSIDDPHEEKNHPSRRGPRRRADPFDGFLDAELTYIGDPA